IASLSELGDPRGWGTNKSGKNHLSPVRFEIKVFGVEDPCLDQTTPEIQIRVELFTCRDCSALLQELLRRDPQPVVKDELVTGPLVEGFWIAGLCKGKGGGHLLIHGTERAQSLVAGPCRASRHRGEPVAHLLQSGGHFAGELGLGS